MPNISLSISEVANIVLSLLVIFQWYRDRAREDAVKNNMFAVREMVRRIDSTTSQDVIDTIDANLATLGARKPYVERCKRTIATIHEKFYRIDNTPVS